MRPKATIHVLVAGTGPSGRHFLLALRLLPSVSVLGYVDPSPGPDGARWARAQNLPLALRAGNLAGVAEVQAVILTSADPRVRRAATDGLPDEAMVIEGQGARLMRRLAGAWRKTAMDKDRLHQVRVGLGAGQEEAEPIIGKSAQMDEVRRLIERVAPTPTPVLLLGETGTGKDLAARSLHRHSRLRNKPFISVNCTALTASLMESELFGYKKGAFTGAEQDRKGLLEEADGGTLFLDEIGDMQLDLQAKMLRFLQTGEVRRVGDTRNRHVSVRVIAATNRDLEAAMGEGHFRSDLFYRFNTFTIHLPPLRERRQDIPYLAYHFLTLAEIKLNKKVESFTDEALAMFAAYDWPGNVRELANVVERAVILCREAAVGAEDLPPQLGRTKPDTAVATVAAALAGRADGNGGEEGFAVNRERIMGNFEKRELLYYLKEADGNVSEACRLSGIPRRTFYRKLRKYGL